MATVRQMMDAGAARYVRNLRAQGYHAGTIGNMLQRRFPGTSWQSALAVIGRADDAAAAAAAFRQLQPNERLRANQLRPADRGCTNWRYYVVVEYLNDTDGTIGRTSTDVTSQQSLSPDQVEAAAIAAFQQTAGTGRPGGFSRGLPAQHTIQGVITLTVERSCP